MAPERAGPCLHPHGEGSPTLFAGAIGSYPFAGSIWLLYSSRDPTKRSLHKDVDIHTIRRFLNHSKGILPVGYVEKFNFAGT